MANENAIVDDIDQAIDASPVLDEVHRRLIQELPHLAKVAHIPEHLVYKPLSGFCTPEEVEWVRGVRSHPENGCYGMWYSVMSESPTIMERMQAIAAACLRNFIDARVMSMQEVINALSSDTMPEPTVLLIPNFWTGWKAENAGHKYKAERLGELLISRQLAGHLTVIYAENKSGLMGQVFGLEVAQLIAQFKQI